MLTRGQLRSFLTQLERKRSDTMAAMTSAKEHALIDLSQDATGDLSHLRLHPADQGADAADQQTELVITSLESQTIARIDEAIRRLHAGLYGICESCGEAIPVARLSAIPETAYCVGCEADSEDVIGTRPAAVLENHIRPAAYTSGEPDLTEQRAQMARLERDLIESGEPILP